MRQTFIIVTLAVLTVWAAGLAQAGTVGYLNEETIVAWGDNGYGQCNVPAGTYSQVAGGGGHTLAIRSDGTLAAWGRNDYGQCNVPAGTYTQVAGGDYYSLALRSDGTVAAWGGNIYGECSVPAGTYTQVAAGGYHGLALRADGTLAAWGLNSNGQCNVPAGTYTQVAGGTYHSLGIRADGTLAAWGLNNNGECSVPAGACTQVDAGYKHSQGLKSDGTLAAWGSNINGQCNVPAGTYTQVAAGWDHSLALRGNGTLVAWGRNNYGQCYVPTHGYFLAVAAGGYHSLGLKWRDVYEDLLVTGTGASALLQRSIGVLGSVTIESMMTMTNNPTMQLPVGGRARIAGGGGITGAGTIWGDVRAEYGSWIAPTGDLVLGNANSFAGFYSDGDLDAGSHSVTINSKATATLGGQTILNGGTLSAPNGMIVSAGRTVAGKGTVNGRFINQGLVPAGGPNEDLTFNGLVSGAGSFTGSIIFNGGYSPGNSATVQHLDWGTFTVNNVLTMEIGGLWAGRDYDHVIANNLLALGGTMNVNLISGFAPQAGNTFDLLDGPTSGTFASVLLPELPGSLGWDKRTLYADGTLRVFASLAGDSNKDGDVTFTDYQALERNFGRTSGATWQMGDFDADADVDFSDYQALERNFGHSIPEPAALAVLLLGTAGTLARKERCSVENRPRLEGHASS